ncbi:MAG: prepilin-type N-terminal cleavage/methylation domain-containing protein [Phycisphaerae bacterium]|nr:prepilin-type N-terminal cleavage/methylation domain-containing protein [Phycisphaerae bacterium]
MIVRSTRPARGFSLVEVLVALAITGMLLSASLAALDASFKSYKQVTESASTNVVTRIVMQRLMAMIRSGTDFGPYPDDPLDRNVNPVYANFIEFQSALAGTGNFKVIRIERRAPSSPQSGPFEIWYVETRFAAGAQTGVDQRPLLTNVRDVVFTLEYDVGPRLRRATVDLTVDPNDFQDAAFHSDMAAPTIRMVSTAIPRKLD